MSPGEQKPPKRSIDERIDAPTMNLELLTHNVQALVANTTKDGENIRALGQIAKIHDRRPRA